jgi:hypothetical protein
MKSFVHMEWSNKTAAMRASVTVSLNPCCRLCSSSCTVVSLATAPFAFRTVSGDLKIPKRLISRPVSRNLKVPKPLVSGNLQLSRHLVSLKTILDIEYGPPSRERSSQTTDLSNSFLSNK